MVNARSEREFNAAFATIVERTMSRGINRQRPIFLSQRAAIATAATAHAVPTVSWDKGFVTAGGLVSYGTGVTWMYHQAGIYCGRILKGAKPADLPVLQPTKFDLVINLKTAQSLGIEIPSKLLFTADEVSVSSRPLEALLGVPPWLAPRQARPRPNGRLLPLSGGDSDSLGCQAWPACRLV